VESLSASEYTDDVLILAGDISNSLQLVERTFTSLARRFAKVLYVPGNHDLWVVRDADGGTSLDKLERIRALSRQCGIVTGACHLGALSIVPLLGWYDHSFGDPTPQLAQTWADYHACRWPAGFDVRDVAAYFATLNEPLLATRNTTVISFSHFLPRIDVMPASIPPAKRILYPVLGTSRLERQIRQLRPSLHVYGHSHVNRRVTIDGVSYINNAFGYPGEAHIAAKRLVCVYEARRAASIAVLC
jgi:predicted phosphodiesterase